MAQTSRNAVTTVRAVIVIALAALPARGHAVPYVPTPYEVVHAMLQVARVGPGDHLMDLGSGDGRIVVVAAEKYGARAVGIEQDAQLVAASRQSAERAQVADRVEFRAADLYETDLRGVSVLTMYLMPSVNMALRLKILDQLAPGARVVSHAYDMGDWRPDEHLVVGDAHVYAWVVPANAAGTWRLTIPAADGEERGETVEIDVQQRFQELTTVARGGGAPVRVVRSALRGEDVELDLAGVGGRDDVLRFRGHVDGARMTGTLSGGRTVTLQRVRAGKISTDPPRPAARPHESARRVDGPRRGHEAGGAR